jgi:hypothetical protein
VLFEAASTFGLRPCDTPLLWPTSHLAAAAAQTVIKGGSCVDQWNNNGATCGFASEYGQRIP